MTSRPPFDSRCLERGTAIRAIFLLWRDRRWQQLGEIGLSKEISSYLDRFALELPGSRIRTDEQVDALLAMLPYPARLALEDAARLLTLRYVAAYGGAYDQRAS